ncbi:MAG: xanthine dehydrogenase family protein molybdopterin-binding subunit [Armatimonadota bacterium]|nr:xanthine dehydrogenase family protein molybdopterin-binding subunit [Armatimonadota bacterium]MDR5697409.1 xanthine dehydrogenase family protein molybdopterin-binding subunit [Armatimonadota bacterium]
MPRIVKTKVEFEGRIEEREVVVEGEDLPPYEQTSFRYVGKPIPRVDGPLRATGRATYTADLAPPGTLHVRFLRSPHAHARIRAVRTERAERMPGVFGVATRHNCDLVWRRWRLFEDVVRYAGDEVAAVCAATQEIAEQALRCIEVDYEPLPFVTDIEDAIAPDAPRVWESGNLLREPPYVRGDVERALAGADVVVELEVRTACALHNSMEPHIAVAQWEGDRLTVWESTQHIFGVRDALAAAFGLGVDRVRVLKQFMGGGFGSKNAVGKYTLIASHFARMTGRPVRCGLDRHEENLCAGNRGASLQRIRLGARGDGTLVAIDATLYTQLGAYAAWAPAIGGPFRELYACPNVRTEEVGVFTHTGPFAAFRAPGYVEGTVGLEVAMDELAARLGIDPLEIRRRNHADRDPATGQSYSAKHLLRAYDLGAERIGWQRRGRLPQGTKRRGLGMASQIWGGAGGPPAYAMVRLNRDGSAEVITGTQDIGTGTRTVLAQIAAEELGLPIERVTVHLGDTENPYSPLSAGSQTLASVGPAVRMAAADAHRQVLEFAAQMLEADPADLRADDGEIEVAGAPTRRLSFRAVAEKLGNFQILGRGFRGPNAADQRLRTFGAQFAEVEVDVDTLDIHVLRIVAVHECGRIINPLTLSSQVEGGILQGVGFALTEGRLLDPATGRPVNANLEDYKIPTAQDAPVIEHYMIEASDDAANNLGAKGMGEPPIIPTAAAIANAVSDALGVRITHLPIRREVVLAAVEQARRSGQL